MPVRNLAVFCASATGVNPRFHQAATSLGHALATHSVGLIYGGASVGLMGAVADATLAHGGRVVGVIPEVLVDKEVGHHGLTELHVVDTMHTRKALMADRADAFLVLPGGFGTMEELFEVLAWQTLQLHNKPILLVNLDGFYDHLLAFLDHAVEQDLLRSHNRAILLVATSIEDALHQLAIPA